MSKPRKVNVAALRRHALTVTNVVDVVSRRSGLQQTSVRDEITEDEFRILWTAARAIAEGSLSTEDAETTAALKRTLAKARAGL